MAQRFQMVRMSAFVLTLLTVFAAPARADFEAGQARLGRRRCPWGRGAVAGRSAGGRSAVDAGAGTALPDRHRRAAGRRRGLHVAESRGQPGRAGRRQRTRRSCFGGMTAEARAEGQRLARDWRPASDAAADEAGARLHGAGRGRASSPEPDERGCCPTGGGHPRSAGSSEDARLRARPLGRPVGRAHGRSLPDVPPRCGADASGRADPGDPRHHAGPCGVPQRRDAGSICRADVRHHGIAAAGGDHRSAGPSGGAWLPARSRGWRLGSANGRGLPGIPSRCRSAPQWMH